MRNGSLSSSCYADLGGEGRGLFMSQQVRVHCGRNCLPWEKLDLMMQMLLIVGTALRQFKSKVLAELCLSESSMLTRVMRLVEIRKAFRFNRIKSFPQLVQTS
jgi:hypothetical protein